jgi:putative DNA primase/helicase
VVQIPKDQRDKDLDTKLHEELPGILAWAVQGCRDWQQLKDLQEPQAVVEATQEYQNEMDILGRFLDECCVTGDPTVVKVKAPMLVSAYQAWCKRTNETPLDNRVFIRDLEKRSYTRARGTANQYYWHGISLVNTEDERYG